MLVLTASSYSCKEKYCKGDRKGCPYNISCKADTKNIVVFLCDFDKK